MVEKEPIHVSEFVYRRIHPNFYDATLTIAVGLEAFRRSQSDASGLSVLRARFAQPQDLFVNRDPAKVSGYHVARLAVRDLHSLGLTVVPEPIPGGTCGRSRVALAGLSGPKAILESVLGRTRQAGEHGHRPPAELVLVLTAKRLPLPGSKDRADVTVFPGKRPHVGDPVVGTSQA